jgi:RNA polymerase sigma-70 factor (ECF subfamily)
MKYQDIIALFHQDLKKGLTLLYEEYGRQLYSFSIAHFHLDEDESYDILYKTLEIVGKVITRYEFTSDKHFANWLFKIHKNNILQFIRTKRSKNYEVFVDSYKNWEEEASELGDDELKLENFKSVIENISTINPYEVSSSNNQLMKAMQNALQQLSELERELLLLRMCEYSYDEIANMLGIENNQLKVKFIRAKAKVEKKTLEILKDNNYETK